MRQCMLLIVLVYAVNGVKCMLLILIVLSVCY